MEKLRKKMREQNEQTNKGKFLEKDINTDYCCSLLEIITSLSELKVD